MPLNGGMADEIRDQLEANALKPQTVQSRDLGSYTQPDPSKLIETDRYLRANTAVKLTRRGLRLSKISPPGAV